MAGMTPAVEAVYDISQSAVVSSDRAYRSGNVPQADELAARAGARDQRLHLLGRQFCASSRMMKRFRKVRRA